MPEGTPDYRPIPVPPEVTGYFDGKTLKPAFAWQDVWTAEHAFAFTVAKATELDVLTALHEEVGRAIRENRSYDQFRETLEPRLKSLGWWGRGAVPDPKTGLPDYGQLGSPRRLRIIYHANMASARAAGEWQRIDRRRALLPYLRYAITTAADPREEHLAWVGTILPVDHPWWRTHYPPNAWLCQCRVEQIGRAEAARLGYDPEKPAPEIVWQYFRNKRTGRMARVPEGIDPGWAGNPGRARARNLANFLAEKLDDAPPRFAKAAAHDLTALPQFAALIDEALRRGRLDPLTLRIDLAFPVAVVDERIRAAVPGAGVGRSVHVSERTIGHSPAVNHAVQPAEWAVLQRLIETGDARGHHNKVTIMGEIDGEIWIAVLRADPKTGGLTVRSLFRPRRPDRYRANQHDIGDIIE
ncbi:MAG: hypothetical protein H6884_09725 [Rhodobiaceae bacterium]|nr:hypothetical protein [Rhodobiaceae bacterium]MCC0054325.1 hypothetical protein [Rhodobiaceae bacterium]